LCVCGVCVCVCGVCVWFMCVCGLCVGCVCVVCVCVCVENAETLMFKAGVAYSYWWVIMYVL